MNERAAESLGNEKSASSALRLIVQGGPKNRTCLSVDNSAMVTRRKACDCDMSKVLECCRQKGSNLHSKSFRCFLPNLHKSLLLLKLGICLHSHMPEFIELKNSLLKRPDLNYVNYLVCMGRCNRWHGHKILVTDQLKRVLIECWAQLIVNTLTPAIDQLPKKTDDGYECKRWATVYVEFHLNSKCVLMLLIFHCMLNENQLKLMCYCQFSMILGVGQRSFIPYSILKLLTYNTPFYR